MKIRQSVCLPMMKPADYPLDDFLSEIAKRGYAAVEIWGRDDEYEEIFRRAKKHGLAIASMVGHGDIGSGLNDPAQHARIEAELRESIDIATRWQIAGLICFSGNRRADLGEDEAIDNAVAGLRRIAPYAEKNGVNLTLELLNSKIDHVGYQCDNTPWGAAVCQQAGSANVKLLYDIYHAQIMEGDIIRTIRENIQWIGHFHTAGVPGRGDIDETQELNYTAICQAIADTGYDLYVGHEFKPRENVLYSLRNAFEICDKEQVRPD
ncbi:TIM barrel protein [candidate division KSB1 bacterium]|nr:TIM barrel protein [candidate division KSB1 bacterium]